MSAITASEARKNLFGLIDEVNSDRVAIEITSKRGGAVLVSQADWDSLVETAYLLSSNENARRLLQSLEDTRAGRFTERDLIR